MEKNTSLNAISSVEASQTGSRLINLCPSRYFQERAPATGWEDIKPARLPVIDKPFLGIFPLWH